MHPPNESHDSPRYQAELNRLKTYYGGEANERLLLLAETWSELTDPAQRALHNELLKRDLWSQVELAMNRNCEANDIEEVFIAIRRCRDKTEADVICGALEIQGIQTNYVLSQKTLEVRVSPTDAERALAFLAEDSVEDVVRGLKQMATSMVTAPNCPQCLSSEVVLSSISETHVWLCERCRASWHENLISLEKSQHTADDSLADDRDGLTGKTEESLDPQRLKQKTRNANIFLLVVILFGTAWAFLATWFEPWTPIRILGLVMFLTGDALVLVARLQLGTSFSGAPRARKLVTTGLYSKIQNPIYLFGALGMTGLILFLDRPIYLLLILIQIPIQLFRIQKERRVLTEHFGEDYLRYRKHTWF
jgi:protein-S-isoprenylcysteine O-methyltransferase Ste14/ribosomal protein L37AE/L43A